MNGVTIYLLTAHPTAVYVVFLLLLLESPPQGVQYLYPLQAWGPGPIPLQARSFATATAGCSPRR